MDDDKPVRDWDRLVLRVPEGVKWMLKERAVKNRRALNGEILHLIEQGIAAETAPNHTA